MRSISAIVTGICIARRPGAEKLGESLDEAAVSALNFRLLGGSRLGPALSRAQQLRLHSNARTPLAARTGKRLAHVVGIVTARLAKRGVKLSVQPDASTPGRRAETWTRI